MEIADITPIYIDGLDCVDNTALTVCNYLRGSYEKVFWNSWDVRYKPDYVIGKGLCVPPGRIQDNIRELYGIEFVPQGSFDRKNCRELISGYVAEDGFVIAGLKSNAFPWKEAYNRDVNGIHFIIFKGVDEQGIWCTDAMPKKENALLGWKDAERGLLSIVRVRECRIRRTVNLCRVMRAVKKNVKPQAVLRLQKRIDKDFDINREFGGQRNIWKIPLYNLFLTVKGRHEQFEMYLKNLGLSADISFMETLHTLTIKWEALKVLTVKIHREYFVGEVGEDKEAKYKTIICSCG